MTPLFYRYRIVRDDGGIPQQNAVLNQVYADVLGKPVLVPNGAPTGFGAGIFASLAARFHADVTAAQSAICLPFKVYQPRAEARPIYDQLHNIFRQMYFGLGGERTDRDLGYVLPALRAIAREVSLQK
jgi:L-ribulokinase